MEKILILGAGIYQLPLIQKANELGYYTIVVSIQGNYPGFNVANKVYYNDTTDEQKILNIAKDEKIDAIITTGTDVAIKTLGYVSEKLNLIGVSEKTALLATNKLLMKKAFINSKVRTSKFIKCENYEEAKAAYILLKKPVILKSVDSSGSRGIIKVNNITELNDAVKFVFSSTKKKYFIIEEFIEGKEFGAQAMVVEGKIKFILPHGDFIFNSNTGVPIGHFVPYKLSSTVLNDIKKQVESSIKALNIKNSALNIDFILKDDKVYVLEIGARAGATCLVELVSIYYDIDYYKAIIDLSLGKTIDFNTNKAIPNCSMLLKSNKEGEIVLQNNNNNKPNNSIYEVILDYKVGDNVNKFSVGPDRIGHVIVKNENLDEALKILNKTIENIQIEVQ